MSLRNQSVVALLFALALLGTVLLYAQTPEPIPPQAPYQPRVPARAVQPAEPGPTRGLAPEQGLPLSIDGDGAIYFDWEKAKTYILVITGLLGGLFALNTIIMRYQVDPRIRDMSEDTGKQIKGMLDTLAVNINSEVKRLENEMRQNYVPQATLALLLKSADDTHARQERERAEMWTEINKLKDRLR